MPDAQASTYLVFALLAFLVPAGLALLAIGASREEHAEQVATTALLALAAAFVGYLACGFAFQFGGAAFVSGMPGLRGLTAEWSPADIAWGPGWGFIGLRGFLLRGEAYTTDVYLLFATHLAAVTTATLVTLLAICSRARRMVQLAVGLLVSGLIYPLFGNWLWGGGWLSNLGSSLGLGHGFVDAAGSGAIFVLGALVALAAFLIIKPVRAADVGPARLPSAHFPLWMVVGALLTVVGWPGLVLGNVLIHAQVSASLVLVNLMMGAAGGALIVSLYSWFVTAQPDGLAIARGTVAGLVAASAACPFMPAWSALAIGAVAGVLFILGLYASERVLRIDDPSGSVATFGLPGLWGLLALAVFADGRWGAGWNGVGAEAYLAVAGQGVSGVLLGPGLEPAGSGQLCAQLTGIAALLVAACLFPWLIFQAAVRLRRLGEPRQPRQLANPAVLSAQELEHPGGEITAADIPAPGEAGEFTRIE